MGVSFPRPSVSSGAPATSGTNKVREQGGKPGDYGAKSLLISQGLLKNVDYEKLRLLLDYNDANDRAFARSLPRIMETDSSKLISHV